MKKVNSMNVKYAIILLVGLIVGLSLTGYYLQAKPQSNEGEVTLVIKSLGVTKTERFKFSKGTALGLLKTNHTVKTSLNDNFIECIDNVCTDKEYWWMFLVNNKTINYGVKRYRLKNGDIVVFEFTNKDYIK